MTRPDREDVAHLIAGSDHEPARELRHYDVPVDLDTLRRTEQAYRANLRAYRGDTDAVYDEAFLRAVERQEPLSLWDEFDDDDAPHDEDFLRSVEPGPSSVPGHVHSIRGELLDYVDRMRDPLQHPLLTHDGTREALCNYIEEAEPTYLPGNGDERARAGRWW